MMEHLLIQKVKEHQILYNSNAFNYRESEHRQAAWEHIGKELGIKPIEAKTKWDRLRKCLTNAISRRRDKKIHKSRYLMPPWKYEAEMSFVIPHIYKRKPRFDSRRNVVGDTNLLKNEKTTEEEVEENPIDSWDLDVLELKTEVSSKSEDSMDDVESKIHKSTDQNVSTSRNSPNIECSKRVQFDRNMFMETPPWFDLDETDFFFLSMSRLAKRLPPTELANIQLILSSTVLQAKLKYINGDVVNEKQKFIKPQRSLNVQNESSSDDDVL